MCRASGCHCWRRGASRGGEWPKEVLELIVAHEKKLLIELKGPFSGLPKSTSMLLKPLLRQPAYPELPRLVSELLKPYASEVRAGQILVQSFHRPYLEDLKVLLPDLRLIYLTLSSGRGWLQQEDLQKTCLGFSGVAVRHASLDSSAIRKLQELQGDVYAWTVDSEGALESMLNAGVQGVITNHAARAVAIRRGARRRRCCRRAKMA